MEIIISNEDRRNAWKLPDKRGIFDLFGKYIIFIPPNISHGILETFLNHHLSVLFKYAFNLHM